MTREEAIERLNIHKSTNVDYGYVREDDYCPLGKRREE